MAEQLTAEEYNRIVQTNGNLTAYKIKKAMEDAASTGDVSGPVSATDEAIVRFDGATGKLIQNSVATITDLGTMNIPAGQTYQIGGVNIASGNVTGTAPTVADTIMRWTNTGATAAGASAASITAAGTITVPAGQSLVTNSITTVALGNLAIVANGSQITLDTGGTLLVDNTTTVDLTQLVGVVLLKNGSAGSVAIGNAIDNGLMFGANTVSISTNGVEKWMVNSSGALNPLLANTYDIGGATSIRDIGIGRNAIVGGVVSAAVGAVGAPSYAFTGSLTTGFYAPAANEMGVAISGALDFSFTANTFTAAAGSTISTNAITNTSTGISITTTGANSITVVSGRAIAATAAIDENIVITTSGLGVLQSVSALGTIELTPNAGWTPCTGTESKAGIDSNDVIYTAGALQNLARTVAALQNILIAKGYLVA